MPRQDVRIDRLVLHLPPMEEGSARRLVGEVLRRLQHAGDALEATAPSIHVRLEVPSGADLDALAVTVAERVSDRLFTRRDAASPAPRPRGAR